MAGSVHIRPPKPAGRKPRHGWRPRIKSLGKMETRQLVVRLLTALGLLLLVSLVLGKLTFRIRGRSVLNDASRIAQPSGENLEDFGRNGKIVCDDNGTDEGFPYARPVVCDVAGDAVVIVPSSSTIAQLGSSRTYSRRLRPYARKDDSLMPGVREVVLRSGGGGELDARHCSAKYEIPGIVFSIGGYTGNFFHDMADVIIPLFLTSYQYKGQVQFFITNYKQWWLQKYKPILWRLSHYDIVDFDTDTGVHCLRHVVVGLRRDRDLILRPDPARNPKNYSMADFTRFLRHSFGLRRNRPIVLGAQPGRKPRMLIIRRTGTRKLLNLQGVEGLARDLGFETVTADARGNVKRFAVLVNSCDVMLAVHGAGMTNQLFLPAGAVVIQVVPWGKMDWMAKNFYGEPAGGMGLQYLEYGIEKEESSLKEKYSEDHVVFRDPLRIHDQGWRALSAIIMAQDVSLNLTRFEPTLRRALDLLQQ